jgi:putative ABC transport system ATP-binding protein
MDRLLGNGDGGAAGAPLVRLEDVTKRYGSVRALDDVTLDIPRGEWLAVMGPSGSGKTTLLNLLGGLDGADAGRITVDGVRLDALGEEERTRYRRDKVGLVFQQFHLLPYLSALENVMVAQYYHSMADAGEAAEALARVGLGDKLDRRPSQLSGGEQQRVCIARALINSPRLLLADEPTGNLDADNEARVLEIFSELHRAGHTLVVVTHAEHVGGLADRRIQLAHGRLTDLLPSRTELEERYDHFLESMWYLRENGASLAWRTIRLPDVAEIEPTARAVEERGLAVRDGERVAFTDKGERRARDIVRRHRLAECLMASTLRLSDPEVNATACRMEHILDPGVTEAICGFLRHPPRCPHAKPIPAGACCPGAGREEGDGQAAGGPVG